jgi:GntR family transcriptional repressor for pyruvate dehydrogenase complex
VDNDVVKLMSGAVAFIFGDRARYDEHREWTLKERRRVHREHLKIAEAVRSGDSTAARQLNEEHFKRINQDVKTMYPSLANEAIDWH